MSCARYWFGLYNSAFNSKFEEPTKQS